VRLGTFLLIPAALTAQSPPLPWSNIPELPWEAAVPGAPPVPMRLETVARIPVPQILVSLAGDGTLRISDAKGVVTLRLGLSGRPLRLLRDAGTPIALKDFPCRFPAETPLTQGLGSLPLAESDFRAALKGLLWILDDGERRITIVHPATHQVVYLPLPVGEDWEINFYADRLVIQERNLPTEERRERACWSVPWLILLPQFMRLSLPPPPVKPGTAFQPFP
jgi:hypothetical protein